MSRVRQQGSKRAGFEFTVCQQRNKNAGVSKDAG